jgi:hypothetical protein
MREPIFAAIKAARAGATFTQAEVARIDALLDSLSVPTNGASFRNVEAFWGGLRKVTGVLDGVQVDIVNRLLADTTDWGNGWLAYALATAWHEARLKPIEEWGKGKGKAYGTVNSTGKVPYGRGLVQLTWHDNYKRADTELNLGGALIKNYDLALDPEIAVKIMVRGMEAGWFTGKSLGSYIAKDHAGTPSQFVNARRIINGTDKDDLIAGYAVKIQDALIAGGRA